VDYICGCIPASIRQALADLPETLDGTYQRTLREIKKADWEHAHRLFQFVSVASRPLRVQELAELLAFDFKAGPVPKFHEDWRLQDPVDAVLSTCSSLLVVVNVEGVPVIQFSHFSVREFLTSTRLAEAGASDIYPRHYHISMTTAHTLAAQVCLGILLHLEKGVITDDSLEKFPLAEYAAEHWVHHAQLGNESRNMQDGMKQLFDPRRPHLAVCVWICDPCLRPSERKLRAKRPLTSPGTALHYAIIWGLHFIVEFLIIERSHDVNPRGFSANATPLHLASERGQVKTALILIEHGADATAQNKDGETPLHMALCRGKVGVARMLIERGPSVSAQNKDGETPLHLALRLGQLGVARMLIERSPDMSAQNKNGETPLHLALRRRQVEVARMLIDRNPVISAQNKDGETPLHLALFGGQVDVARMLIERSSDVSARNKDGETPLHLALRRGQMEVARMLIRHGADVAAQDMDEETPLHLVSREGQVEIGRMLIKRGADLTAQNKDGETLLHLALRWGQVEFARMLIERDVNVMARNKSGWTPLHLALFWGRVDIAHMLIEHGADVESRNNDGDTPLLLALTPSYWTQKSSRQYAEVTRILLEHGADANAQNKYGLTPFRLASQGELADVVNVLLEHGADPVTHNDMD
jgi:ankyrin repeat protein